MDFDMSKNGKYSVLAVEDRIGMRTILTEGIEGYFRFINRESPFEITVYENPDRLLEEVARRNTLTPTPYGLVLDIGIEERGVKKKNTTLTLEAALARDPSLLQNCLMGLIWSGMNAAVIAQDQGIYAWQRRIAADPSNTPGLVITPKSADSIQDVMTLGDVLRYGFGLYEDHSRDLSATRADLNEVLSSMGRGGICYQGSRLLERPVVIIEGDDKRGERTFPIRSIIDSFPK
jgi:hypothetical protein